MTKHIITLKQFEVGSAKMSADLEECGNHRLACDSEMVDELLGNALDAMGFDCKEARDFLQAELEAQIERLNAEQIERQAPF